MLCVHRLREGLKTDRTACVNRIRGLLADFGLVFGKSAKVLRAVLSNVIEDASNQLAAWPVWSCSGLKSSGPNSMPISSGVTSASIHAMA